ncbi:hypothetical protein HK101_005147, partial [Irineochytrium annulatum]
PGWTPHMLRIERPSWSDEEGALERPPKANATAPPAPGWEWITDDWVLDKGWTQVDPEGWGSQLVVTISIRELNVANETQTLDSVNPRSMSTAELAVLGPEDGLPLTFDTAAGDLVITGRVLVSSKQQALKDCSLMVAFTGESFVSGQKQTLLALTKPVEVKGGTIGVGDTIFPFSFSLRKGPPPSFRLFGGTAYVEYQIKCTLTHKQGLVKRTKEAEAPVTILAPAAQRGRALALQAPITLQSTEPSPDDNGPGSPIVDTRQVGYHMHIKRRVVMPGESVYVTLTLWPLSDVRIASVLLAVRSSLEFRRPDMQQPVSTEAAVLAAVRDPAQDGENPWNVDGGVNGANSPHRPRLGAMRTLTLAIPGSATPTIDAGGFKHTYQIRLTVTVEGSGKPAVVVDAPLSIFPRGDPVAGPNALPVLPRTDSNGREVSPFDDAFGIVDSDDGPVPHVVLYAYNSMRPDEVDLLPGEKVHVSDTFADGWGCVKKEDGKVGFAPMHHLSPDLGAAELTVPPPSSPRNIGSTRQAARNSTESLGTLPTYSPPTSPMARMSLKKDEKGGNGFASPPLSPANLRSAPPKAGASNGAPNASNGPAIVPVVTDVVVTPATLEAHLGLLHRFVLLESADQLADWRYLCHAEQRYLMWLDYLKEERPDPSATPLPPLDVALIWHSHMLSPLRYYEDFYHIYNTTTSPYMMPIQRMHEVAGKDYLPVDGSKEVWEAFTGEPFTLPLGDMTPFNFRCPFCYGVTGVDADQFVLFRMKDGSIRCNNCGAICTSDNVSAKRFLDDVKTFRDYRRPLKGTPLDEKTGVINLPKATADLQIIFSSPDAMLSRGNPGNWGNCNWIGIDADLAAVLQNLRTNRSLVQVRKSTLPKMVRAYRNQPIPLSMDMVAAVNRQRKFTKKMVGGVVDWLERDAIPRATVRYAKFMNLMQKEPGKVLVPTLDIDLAWHTHQLHPLRYQTFTQAQLGLIVNHDDSIEQKSLDDSFAITSKLWRRHYRERYAVQPIRGHIGAGKDAREARRKEKSLFPPYAMFARSRQNVAETVTGGGGEMGGCRIHDASAPLVDRRSNAMFPVGSTQPRTVQTPTITGMGGRTARGLGGMEAGMRVAAVDTSAVVADFTAAGGGAALADA